MVDSEPFKSLGSELACAIETQIPMLASMFDSSPDFIFCKDTQSRFTYCNKSALNFFNVELKQIIGKTAEETFALSHQAKKNFEEEDAKVINEKATVIYEKMLRSRLGNKKELIVETVKTPIIDNGKVTGILGVSRDISERKMLEEKHELQTSTLAALFDSIPDFIYTKDLRFRFLQCNKNFLNYFGLRAEDIIGKTDAEVFGLSDEEAEKSELWDKQVILEGRTISKEEHLQQSGNGVTTIVETLKTPLVFNGIVTGVLCIISNITRFKELEEQALAASRSKSVFLANMSHEIRTPMNSIIGFSELALDYEIPGKVKNYLHNILTNSKWLLQMISDILDISKIESGRIEMEKVPFDLHEILNSCRAIIIPKVLEKKLSLQFYTEPNTGKKLLGDPFRLKQVFVNLLSNAVKFTDSGFIKVSARINEKSENTVTMHFEVADSGIGMTSSQMKRIFTPFMQGETSTTRKYGGTGLGLPIANNTIELLGGKLHVESVVGKGSTFSFELTFDTIEAFDEVHVSRSILLKDYKHPVFSGEVLVCEDNVMNQQLITEHLARVGLKTVIAENGKVGVEMVERRKDAENQFVLIFMDIHMPQMDGLEASEKILAMDDSIPIVAMTANIMPEDMETYKKTGMSGYIGKPFKGHELWDCLLQHLSPTSWQVVKKIRHTKIESYLRGKIAEDFVKDNQNKWEEIKNAIDSGDIKLAHRLTHTLKSNAAHLGSSSLRAAAANLESLLKYGNNLSTDEHLLILKSELAYALAELTQEISDNAKLRKTDADAQNAKDSYFGNIQELIRAPVKESAQALIEEIAAMLNTGNPDCLKLALLLRQIPTDNSINPLIEELIQNIENFDFEQAAVVLSDLKLEWGINSTEEHNLA